MSNIKHIVIVGGGFAGWYTATSLQNNIPGIKLTVIESPIHPTMSVGEVTGFDAPLNFKRLVGLENDHQLMANSGAIYKYGIRAVDFFQDGQSHDWGKFPNLKVSSLTSFYNGFDYPDFQEPWNRKEGDIGLFMAWLSMNQGKNRTYDDFIIETTEQYNFVKNPWAPYDERGKYVLRGGLQGFSYHLDAITTGNYLKTVLFDRDKTAGRCKNIVGTVVDITFSDQERVNVDYLLLDDGTKVSGDLFIDCTGTKRALMSRCGNNSWEKWSDEYNNASWAAPTKYSDTKSEMIGRTEFFGEDWGWRFKVRLYHRVGNGYVFNTNMVDPETVYKRFEATLDKDLLADPILVKWQPGQYLNPWQGNLVPLGMAAGIIDPYDAPTFDLQSRSLEDLIRIINSEDNSQEQMRLYNHARQITRDERNFRLNLSMGFSRRRGPFWDSRRNMAVRDGYIKDLKRIVLEQCPDLEERMPWHWHHIYARVCMACGVDMSSWEFPKVSAADAEMADAFFKFNRARNTYIQSRPWTNYSEWLRDNRFGGATSEEMLQQLNPRLV
jgi:tryptophan halogenase